MNKTTQIGAIENYYGGLLVTQHDSKYYWGLDTYNDINWQEIPKSLYDSLLNFNDNGNNTLCHLQRT